MKSASLGVMPLNDLMRACVWAAAGLLLAAATAACDLEEPQPTGPPNALPVGTCVVFGGPIDNVRAVSCDERHTHVIVSYGRLGTCAEAREFPIPDSTVQYCLRGMGIAGPSP